MENKKKDAFWLFYDENAHMMNKHINPDELLPHVGHLIPVGSQEAIRAAVTNKGKTYAIPTFIDALRMRDDSHVHFFNALKQQRGLQELVNFIQEGFIEDADAVSSSNACVQPTLPRAAGDSRRLLPFGQPDGSHGNAPTAAGSVVAADGASSAVLSTEQQERSTRVAELLTLSQTPENVSSRLSSATIPAKAAGSIGSPLQSKSAATPSRLPYRGRSPFLYETADFTGARTLSSQAASSDEEHTISPPTAGYAGNGEALREGRRDFDGTAVSASAKAHGQPGAEKYYASRRQDNMDDAPAQGQEHFGIQESRQEHFGIQASRKTSIPASKTLLPQPKLLGSSQQCPTARPRVSQQVSSSTSCTADERLPAVQQQQLNCLGHSSYRARRDDSPATSNASVNISLSLDENGTLSTLTDGAVAVHRMAEQKEADTDRSDGSPENSDIYRDAARALRSFPGPNRLDVDSTTDWTASVLGGLAVAAPLLVLMGMYIARR